MFQVFPILRLKRYQELNEPQIFSWRYVAKGLAAHEIFRFEVERRNVVVRVTVTLKWGNKARRKAELIAYDDTNGYCLLGTVKLPSEADATEVRGTCRKHAEAYLARLWGVAKGVADPLHKSSKWGYEKFKRQLQRKLGIEKQEPRLHTSAPEGERRCGYSL